MSLDKVFFLKTSGQYANPEQSGDKLPIVYGDLTDGTKGIWQIPKIQKWNGTSTVYCYAGHQVLSIVNGNTVTVYKDNVEVTTGVTFSSSNNFEGQGTISTISFDTQIDNQIISVTGQGKHKTSPNTELLTNIIDIIDDFLITEVNDGFVSSDFETTSKVIARNQFTDLGYLAAGVINQNQAPWKTLAAMMSTFKGGAFLNGDNKLKLTIEDGTLQQSTIAGVISRADIKTDKAKLQRINLVNRVPAEYAFNYITNDYSRSTDALTEANQASIGIFGTQRPKSSYKFPWCRDLNTVHNIQTIIVGNQSTTRKIWEITFTDNTMKRTGVEVGDLIIATFDPLFDETGEKLINEIFKVLNIAYNFNVGTTVFRVLDTGSFLTTQVKHDGTFLHDGTQMAGGEHNTVIF